MSREAEEEIEGRPNEAKREEAKEAGEAKEGG
jgi:hypothetical protein